MIGLPRSTFYYRPDKSSGIADSQVVELIEATQDDLPGYGYRRITHELRRRDHRTNHKRIARIMRENGLRIKPRRRFVKTTDSAHFSLIYPHPYRNVIPERPDMALVADLT